MGARGLRAVPTSLPGLLVLEPVVHRDERGFFLETFRADGLAELGITETWVQDNHSRSTRGVARGMHFQVGQGQAKLVRCARGSVLDVCVDLRRGSPTYGRHDAVELDDVSARMVYVPVGFAHGFCVTSAVADVIYRCSSYYDPAAERAVSLADPALGLPWPAGPLIVSDRDRAAPALAEVADELPFVWSGP